MLSVNQRLKHLICITPSLIYFCHFILNLRINKSHSSNSHTNLKKINPSQDEIYLLVDFSLATVNLYYNRFGAVTREVSFFNLYS